MNDQLQPSARLAQGQDEVLLDQFLGDELGGVQVVEGQAVGLLLGEQLHRQVAVADVKEVMIQGGINPKLTFDWFLTPFGWLPPVLFSCVLGFGAIYWMRLQGRYNRKAKEQGGML